MNEIQLAEIRNYLLTKKLPIDILIEVQDHFVSQILDLQWEENLSFEEAFEQTKLNWKKELHLYWDGSIDLMDNSKFKKKMEQQIWFSILKKATLYLGLSLLMLLFLANIFNVKFFGYFITSLMILATIFPAAYYFYNIKKFGFIKKYDNYVLTLYQVPAATFLSVLGVAVVYIPRTFEKANLFHEFFRLKMGWENIGLAFAFLFIIFSGILIFLSQREYLYRMEKVKPFLKYLKPNS